MWLQTTCYLARSGTPFNQTTKNSEHYYFFRGVSEIRLVKKKVSFWMSVGPFCSLWPLVSRISLEPSQICLKNRNRILHTVVGICTMYTPSITFSKDFNGKTEYKIISAVVPNWLHFTFQIRTKLPLKFKILGFGPI
jgi:hypothetical protein